MPEKLFMFCFCKLKYQWRLERCLLWFGDLIDVRTLGMPASQKLYIRVSAEYIVKQSGSWRKRKIVIIALIIATSISLLSLASILIWQRKSQKGGCFSNNNLLAWRRRFAVITGIARGLLYLHRDSRLRIIHRDFKASNVLLDSEMNPKNSDFGMAKTFGEDQFTMETKRVVGTYGYMAPEYAIDGVYSMKSDVFSFGVLVLEIASGKRNNQFHHPDHNFNLLGHAWQLWLGGRASELIDPLMEDSFAVSEVLRCIQIGLLCVQQRPEDRPTMAAVLLMVDSESAMLPQPKRPGYYTERFLDESELPSDGRFWTVNDLTDTMIHGR